MLAAWALFHAGEFQKAAEAGLKLHGAGAGAMTVANKAQAIYATYLESSEKTKLALLLEVAERAESAAREEPEGRQRLVLHGLRARPLQPGHQRRQGAGAGPRARKVKNALETTIKLAPKHADAHIALGAFHAEVIDKVGSLLGRTQGASKDTGLSTYKDGARAQPELGDRAWSNTPTAW